MWVQSTNLLRGTTADTAYLPDVSSLILSDEGVQQSLFDTGRQRDTLRLAGFRETHSLSAVLDKIPTRIGRASHAEQDDYANGERCSSPVLEIEFGNVGDARPCNLESGFGERRHRLLHLNAEASGRRRRSIGLTCCMKPWLPTPTRLVTTGETCARDAATGTAPLPRDQRGAPVALQLAR